MSDVPYRCGWVAVIGPPNAGKSTLLNTYLGQKVAIVSPLPQTTRNQITGILSDEEAQVLFMDTPGILQTRGKMNRLLAQSAWNALRGADVVCVMLDADLSVRRPDFMENDLAPLRKPVAEETRPVFVIANKVDLILVNAVDPKAIAPVVKKAKAGELDMLQFTAEPADDGSRLSCQIVLTQELDGLTVRLPARQY